MIKGWKLISLRTNPKGGPVIQVWAAAAIPDRETAIRAVQSFHPEAEVRIDSEADAEFLEKYGVEAGKVVVIVEGT